MIFVFALHAAGAAVLVVAGLAKLARPGPAADLLARLGLPARLGLVRLAGLAECALGTAALAVGDPASMPGYAPIFKATGRPWPLHGEAHSALAATVGGLYAVFAFVVLRARRLGAPSCGCLGRAGGPPSLSQAAVDLVFAAAALIASTAQPGSTSTPLEVLEHVNPLLFIPAVGVIAGLALAVLSANPQAGGWHGGQVFAAPRRKPRP